MEESGTQNATFNQSNQVPKTATNKSLVSTANETLVLAKQTAESTEQLAANLTEQQRLMTRTTDLVILGFIVLIFTLVGLIGAYLSTLIELQSDRNNMSRELLNKSERLLDRVEPPKTILPSSNR